MRIFEHLNYDFLGKRKTFYYVSIGLFLIGLINFFIRGMQFGIDFKGGSEIVLQFQKPVDIAAMRNYVENIGLGSVELKTFGSETGVPGAYVPTPGQEFARLQVPDVGQGPAARQAGQ